MAAFCIAPRFLAGPFSLADRMPPRSCPLRRRLYGRSRGSNLTAGCILRPLAESVSSSYNVMARTEMALLEPQSPIRTFDDSLRHDWTRDEVRALFELPLSDLIFRAQTVHREFFDPSRGANVDAAFDQDRRLPRGLRLLSAERPLRHRRGCREADAARQGAGRGARRTRCRRQPLLHGRRLALAEGSRSRPGLRDDRGGQSPWPRDLRDARHADRTASAEAEGGRSRLLQPQPRHLAGFLRQDHLHPYLSTIGWKRWSTCARPASMSAAAASSAWEKHARTGSA